MGRYWHSGSVSGNNSILKKKMSIAIAYFDMEGQYCLHNIFVNHNQDILGEFTRKMVMNPQLKTCVLVTPV